jgi:Tol biopolymer transport system component
MGLDGENPKQLTGGTGMDGRPVLTPDSQWVIYENIGEGRKSTLWKVNIDGGAPVKLTEQCSDKATISPDGRFVACIDRRKNTAASIVIIPADASAPVRTLESPAIVNSSTIRWTADGLGLVYIDSRDRVYNLWTQPVSGGPPKQLSNFSSDRIFGFDVSPDGKSFALARGHETSDVVLINSFK